MPQSKDSRPQYTTKKKKEKRYKNTILENIKKEIAILVPNERAPCNRFVRARYLDIFFPPKTIIFNRSRVNSYYIAWLVSNIYTFIICYSFSVDIFLILSIFCKCPLCLEQFTLIYTRDTYLGNK